MLLTFLGVFSNQKKNTPNTTLTTTFTVRRRLLSVEHKQKMTMMMLTMMKMKTDENIDYEHVYNGMLLTRQLTHLSQFMSSVYFLFPSTDIFLCCNIFSLSIVMEMELYLLTEKKFVIFHAVCFKTLYFHLFNYSFKYNCRY